MKSSLGTHTACMHTLPAHCHTAHAALHTHCTGTALHFALHTHLPLHLHCAASFLLPPLLWLLISIFLIIHHPVVLSPLLLAGWLVGSGSVVCLEVGGRRGRQQHLEPGFSSLSLFSHLYISYLHYRTHYLNRNIPFPQTRDSRFR